MSDCTFQDVHNRDDERVGHFCPPPCCWACSFTDSSPKTLLAAMKLKGRSEKGGSRRKHDSGGKLTVHHASCQVHACIPPGHWSSGGGSQCQRGYWKAERAVNAADSVPGMSASLESIQALSTNLGVYRTSCRCFRALPEVAIDCRCALWLFVFIVAWVQ